MKIIQLRGGFTQDETMGFVKIVQSNAVSQMKLLLTVLQQSNLLGRLNNESKDALQLLNTDDFTPATANWIKILWNDKAIRQLFFSKNIHVQFNDSAAYFFDEVERFGQVNYVPSQEDILRARVRSTGIEEAEFIFDDIVFNMVDVGGQRSERRKWLHCFSGVDAILFVASLSCYDQSLREDIYQNAMMETLLLFQEVTTSDHFRSNQIILFLNKMDLFEKKDSSSAT